jgi:hypothetical protein
MRAIRFERTLLPRSFVIGWMAFFGITIAQAQAQAQFVNPVPSPPPPVLNPSSPNTVPQSPETPVAPGTPSTLSGSGALSLHNETPQSTVRRSHRPIRSSTTETANVAKVHLGRHSRRNHLSHRRRPSGEIVAMGPDVPAVRCPCYFPLYASSNYPPQYGPVCVWHREWDGQWFNHCN